MKWLYTITNLSRLKNFTHLNISQIQLLNQTEEHFCQWVEVPKQWNTFEIFDYLLTGPLLTLVLVVGLFGGYFCLAAFWLGCKNLRIYIYLLVLAVWDVLYLLTAFYLYNLPVYIYQEIVHFGPLIILQPYIYYLSAVARTGCIWSVLVIAVERYLALCHPFKFQSWSGTGSHQQQRLTTIFCTMILGAFCYCLPRLFELNVIRCLELTSMDRVPKRTVAPLRNSFEYWLLYRVIGGLLLYSIVPFLIIVVLTVKISYEIRRLPQWETRPPSMIEATRGDLSSAVGETRPLNGSLENSRCSRTSVALAIGRSSSAASAFPERRLNQWMYVAMISKFLLCYSIPVILDTWEMVDPDVNRSKSWAKAFFMMSGISSFLVALNSSLNFFIYYSTSDRFRADSVRAVKLCTSSMSRAK